MKKLFLSICFLTTLTCVYAQNAEPKAYVAFDNSIFRQGDSLYIGYKSGYKQFEYIKEYYFKGLYDKGFINTTSNIVGKKFKILDIYNGGYLNSYDTSAVVLKIGEKGLLGLKLYVDINNAIRKGEVIINLCPQWSSNEKIPNFSDSIAFLYKIKQYQQPPMNFSLEYLRRFNEKNYEKYREDEFELENQKQMSINKIKEGIASMNDTTTYHTDIELSLDNYDFSTMSFPVGFEKYFTILRNIGGIFPETNLVFINQNNFSKLAVEKSIANSFIKRRKNIFGNINRTVFARVYFKYVTISTNAKSTYVNSYGRDFIFGTISRIEFFDLKNRLYNYIGQTVAN